MDQTSKKARTTVPLLFRTSILLQSSALLPTTLTQSMEIIAAVRSMLPPNRERIKFMATYLSFSVIPPWTRHSILLLQFLYLFRTNSVEQWEARSRKTKCFSLLIIKERGKLHLLPPRLRCHLH